jgi:alpha-tubulin suppressor-like RCC1 family protein
MLLSACGAGVEEVAKLPGNATATTPTVTAVVSPLSVVTGKIYTYQANVTGNATGISWNWGDGTTDTVGINVQKVWSKPGTYSRQLKATVNGQAVSIPENVDVVGEPLSIGLGHACAISTSRSVNCWGRNDFLQLGDPNITNVSGSSTVSALTNVNGLAASNLHTCALKSNGTVYCWGNNSNGQLGNGNTTTTATPSPAIGVTDAIAIANSGFHSCALKATGGVSCWGSNFSGQLGNGTTTNSVTPVDVLGLTDATAISASTEHTCALKTGGVVYCWGRFVSSQGVSLVPVQIAGINDAIALASNTSSHTCALRASGRVNCWGNNSVGQIGNGTTSTFTASAEVTGLTDAVAIAVGRQHSCALQATGKVSCWGWNISGQLGDGTVSPFNANAVTVVGINDAVSVTVGGDTSCALRAGGGMSCWGFNISSLFSTGNSPGLPAPTLSSDWFWR